jgi:PAS domain S-box-containing protein
MASGFLHFSMDDKNMLHWKGIFILTLLLLLIDFSPAATLAGPANLPDESIQLTKTEQEYLKNHQVLRVQCAGNWPPYNFREGNKPKGFVNDYLRLIAEKLNIQLEFIAGHSWVEFMEMLQTGEIDLISNMTVTPDRRKKFLFSKQPVFNVLNGLLTLKSNNRQVDLESLRGKTLAVVRGYSQEELLHRYYPNISLFLTNDLLDSIRQIMAGKAEAAIGAHAVFHFLAQKHLISEIKSTPISNNSVFPSAPHHLAVNKNNQVLITILDKAMATVSDKELQNLHAKWLNTITETRKRINFSDEELKFITAKKEITMCADPNWFPLEKIENGKHIGIAADYMRLLSNKIGIPITLVPTKNWSESIRFTKNRKCDIFSLAMSTPKRRRYMFFSEPYLKIPLVLASRTVNPFVNDITTLTGKKMGVVKGYAFGELLRKKYPGMEIVDVSSIDKGLEMVTNRELYGYIGTLITVSHIIQQKYIGELKIAGKFNEQWELGVACRNDSPLLLSIFNKAIRDINETTRQQILNRWLPVTFESGINYTLLWRILAGVSAVFLGLLYHSYTLRQYNKKLRAQNKEIIRQANLLKETQTALQLTQQAVDSCAFPICWLTPHKDISRTTFIHANQAAADLLGYSREEMLQLSITDFDREQTQQSWEKLLQILKKKQSMAKQGTFTRKDGTTFPTETYISSFQYENRSYHFIFFTDASREKEMEKKLHRSMKMEAIGTMAGSVAHDLNNILSGVVSYPELLILRLPEGSELQNPLETIRQAGIRAAEVVADLLTVARGIAAVKEPASLNTIINEYCDSLEFNKLKEQYPGINYVTNLAPDLLNICCSQLHIKKCLMNLITNSAEAIEEDGIISVSTTNRYMDEPFSRKHFIRKGEYVVLTVADNGPGIPGEFLPHIFEPFYTKKIMGKSGTGLGLSIVWNTIHDHNGAVEVSSNGQGTTFTLYFPATHNSPQVNAKIIGKEQLKGNGEHILVIDDEPQQRDICRQMLLTLGYRVDTVASGNEALLFLKKRPVDLLILDMILEPELDGMQTFEKLIQLQPGLKAIIVSGFSQSDNVARTLAMGAGQFISKPYSLRQLGQAVLETLNPE